jgi:hypothetical protein
MQSWIHNPLRLSFKDQGKKHLNPLSPPQIRAFQSTLNLYFTLHESFEGFRSHGYKVGALIGRIVQTRILGQGLTKTVITLSS